MAGRKTIDAENLKQLVLRTNTSLLQYGVILFQVTAMLLLAFKTEGSVDTQALLFAAAMPLGTVFFCRLFSRFWPIDRALLLLVMFLLSVSLVTLKAIARSPITPAEQAYYILAGFAAMAFGIFFIRHVRSWEKWLMPLLLISLCAVASPLVLGSEVNGAKNWLIFKKGEQTLLSIQPSEFVKFTLIYILAASFSRNARLRSCIPAIFFAALLCGILMLEKDLGAVLIYFLTTLALFYAATANLPVTLAGLAAGSGAAVLAYKAIPLVQKRVELYLDPWSDPLVGGYQLVQALIAIGSGGMFGMGLGLGLPRNVPLYHSDFIFASIAEQYGLIFSLLLIAVYVLILMRGLSIATNARTSFHALLAFGVVCLIGLQTFINIGGNIKLIPLT
ncbi:MAG: FtsW/RodA/SpoVE family cell cycle protein, partial [Eubacteriales bacterium]|nr:FtsW/RodA/SpoVE family cell cycle protein [Eubacteriales bacterium]